MRGDRVGIGSHTRPNEGAKDEWLTPPWLLAALGPFDMDPCSPIIRPWDIAARHLTREDDGLVCEWKGFVWCNPPYGRQTWAWLDRMREHGDGIALTFARTETAGFVRTAWTADALLFIAGRLFFHHADGSKAGGNAGGPSVLLAYGPRAVDRLAASDIGGAFVPAAILKSAKDER